MTRLNFYRDAIAGEVLHDPDDDAIAGRLALMLSRAVMKTQTIEAHDSWLSIKRIQGSEILRNEFSELLDSLRDAIPEHIEEVPYQPEQPLYLHRRYTRDEILVAAGYQTLDNDITHREGRLWLPKQNRELFLVTLDKTERHFSPTTRYEDFAVSRTRFHWQSQSTTGENTATGLRYAQQASNNVDFVLFVREKSKDPYMFLGPVRYVSHQGTRPMSVYWNLVTPMPAWFFEICASLRAA